MSDANILDCLYEDLLRVWSAETSSCPERWTQELPSRGQSEVTALIINALLGGRIVCFDLGLSGYHYANWVQFGDKEDYVDFTADQFDFDNFWKHNAFREVTSEQLCDVGRVGERFLLLSGRLRKVWQDDVSG